MSKTKSANPDKHDFFAGKNLDRSTVLSRISAKARDSQGNVLTKMSVERERTLEYYNMEAPRRQTYDNSSYVSSDVYDGVETLKAQVLEVVSGSDDIVRFDADSDMNQEQCDLAMQYSRYVLFRQNNGYDIFDGTIYDGLMARIGVVKVYWDEQKSVEERSFKNFSREQVEALKTQEDVETLEADEDETTPGIWHGTFTVEVDASQVCIENIPPEEFLIAARTKRLDNKWVDYVGHRKNVTKQQLLDMDFDKDLVDEVAYDDYVETDFNPDTIARNMPSQAGFMPQREPVQDELRSCLLYESYTTMVLDSDKGARLYKIMHTMNVLLDIEEVDRLPFKVFVPLPIPHLIYGNNFAARLITTQDARSVLHRAILGHAAMTVTPQFQVVNGGLVNPRELVDNTNGQRARIVNVKTPEAITPIVMPQLQPYAFQLLQKLEDNAQKMTGLSQLAQGLNDEAVSKQNSRGLINDLVTLATIRQKMVCRNFVYSFLAPLYQEIVRLVILNEKQKKEVDVGGAVITLDTQKWTEREFCSFSFVLGYGEMDSMAQKTEAFLEKAMSNPKSARFITDDNLYNSMMDIAKMSGIHGVSRYITNPKMLPSAQPPQPDPIKLQEAQAKQMSARADFLNAASSHEKNQRVAAMDLMKQDHAKAQLVAKVMEADRNADRRDLETMNRIHIAQEELELQKQHASDTPTKDTTSFAPRI